MGMRVEIETKEIPRVKVGDLPCLAVLVNSPERRVFLLSHLKNPVTMRAVPEGDGTTKTLNVAVTHLQGEGGSEIISAAELELYTQFESELTVLLKN